MLQVTVSSLLRYLKNKLDTDNNIQRVLVSGEISNFHNHFSGHLYFTLKDDNAAINCVMFKSNASKLTFTPKTGDKVIIQANTSIFETTGQLQLYVLKMNLDGLGDLYLKFEQLKNKLNTEGYFSDDHKKVLTKTYLDKVAVLVGDKSAAMSDIKTTFNRRWPLCKVDYYPVLVQGLDAPNSIINELKKVDELDYDAIILARGGGSFEDLFCFNDENLVKTVYDLKTFIITGVGHEQDFTLVDFVADKRAATPTASVELITPNIIDTLDLINDYEYDLNSILNDKFNNIKMNYDYLTNKLLNYQAHLNLISNEIDMKLNRINNNLKLKIERDKLSLKRLSTLLEAYNINNTLQRGYTILIQDDKVVKTKKELIDKEFNIKFIDGTIKAKKV